MTGSALPERARVLIVRMGALGDIVHALPVLAALEAQRPDVEVDWLVDARYDGVLALVHGLRRRIVVRAKGAGGSEGSGAVRFGGARGLVGAIADLRRQRYAAALDLQGLMKSAVFARVSGAARVIGFERRALREPQAAWWYREHVPADDAGHVIHKNLAVLAALGLRPGAVEFPWAPQRSAVRDAVMALPAVRQGQGLALLNPGAAWENKRWPPERFGALAAALAARHGLVSLVTWGPGERERADAVARASEGHALVSPPTALADVLALAQVARLCVSGDTGPLHLAAAAGTPLVGLFGPTRPERNGPFRADDVAVARSGECVCFHKRRCVIGAACIERIAVEEVLEACSERLARRERAS